MQDRFKSASQSALVEFVGIVLFAAVVALVAGYAQPNLSGLPLILVGTLIAIVPAAIWLTAFYRQDRVEPEPKRFVLGVFILGALLAQAVGQPVIRELFQVQRWAGQDAILGFLGSVFIVGLVQEFLKYAAVRYTIFNAQEFDQPVDGIIYAASAGLGYATMTSIQYVIGNGGVDLGVGAIRVSVEALAQASTAGVIGYFLGQAKFRSMGPLWLPGGLLLSALLNGIIAMLLDLAPQVGTFGFNAWAGLVAAAAIAGVTFGVLMTIIRRLNTIALAQSR